MIDLDYTREMQAGRERICTRILEGLPEGSSVESGPAPDPYGTSVLFVADSKQMIVPDGIIIACARMPANVLHHFGEGVMEMFKTLPADKRLFIGSDGPRIESK